ncbi:MAG: hypothetical protein P4M04_02445 [Acidobacteriota bacterium]|nr:hypothetical protein [Acidobacteriota bacterium]
MAAGLGQAGGPGKGEKQIPRSHVMTTNVILSDERGEESKDPYLARI